MKPEHHAEHALALEEAARDYPEKSPHHASLLARAQIHATLSLREQKPEPAPRKKPGPKPKKDPKTQIETKESSE